MVVVEEEEETETTPGRRSLALFQSAVPSSSFCKIGLGLGFTLTKVRWSSRAQPTIQPLPLRCRGSKNLQGGGIRLVADRK